MILHSLWTGTDHAGIGGLGQIGKRRRLAGCDFFSAADFVSAVTICS